MEKGFFFLFNQQQGSKSPEHFGFICHDSRSGQYNCYVFKGQSEQLVSSCEIVLMRAVM